MGIRIELPQASTDVVTSNPVADNFLKGLNTVQQPVDTIGTMGGTVHNMLESASSGIDTIARDPLDTLEPSINTRIGAINGSLGVAVQVGPSRAMQQVSSLAGNMSRTGSNVTSAFNTAKSVVTDTKALTALAVGLACLLIGALIQGIMSKLSAAALRLQRTALAQLDKLRKAAVELVEKAINAAMEALPDCPQALKDVAQELRSILGKASAITAAINRLMRDAASCGTLGAAVGTALASLSLPLSLLALTTKSRTLVSFDFDAFTKELDFGINDKKNNVTNNKDFYHNTEYIDNTVTVPIENALAEVMQGLDTVNGLIADSNANDSNPNNEKDSPQYKQALEDMKNNLENLADDLENARENLAEDTLKIVDELSDHTNNSLDDVQKAIEDNMEDIKKSADDIFEGLENIAKELDEPVIREQLITSCADTALRTVIDNN